MKQLILMRHAKSDWSAGAGSDHARPLNPRGRRAATALGDWLRKQDLVPDEVLCSDAMRTRETLLRLDLPEGIPTTFSRALYLATHDDLLKIMRGATGNRVLMLGHNPGIGWCAEAVLQAPPDHPQFSRYPTCATLVAEFEIDDWAQAGWGKAKARHFIVPREL
ncbi:MAG: histidine phosphatase family protein [Sulfitobacter sp.]|nr:histidine phosphatase family protein [Sulfitobacter sp.]